MDRTISGNVGEWSEIYVFLKLLSEKIIRGADENLNPKEGIYFELNEIIRRENEGEVHYRINREEGLVDVVSEGKTQVRFKFERFGDEAKHIFEKIRGMKGRTSASEKTQGFMKELGCTKLKAPSKDKTDIETNVYDPKKAANVPLGFSIKSYVRGAPTLLNASNSTNFFFEIDGMNENDAHAINQMFKASIGIDGEMKEHTDILNRMKSLKEKGYKLRYAGMENETFRNNMVVTDPHLPETIGAMLIEFYMNGINDVKGQTLAVSKKNPMGYNMSEGHPFYSQKVKKLLSGIAIGMVPHKVWKGTEEANGGYIVVKETGDIVCYHLYHRVEFEEYLFNNTVLEKPSTTRHNYASIEKTYDGKYRIKLNLQIRFRSTRGKK